MKPSPYNHFFELQNKNTILAYNAFSGALAEIEQENYARVLHLIDLPADASSAQDHEFLQCLKDGGFLVGDAIDQRAIFENRAKMHRLSGDILTLTIAPTLACNFGCDYCFESRSGMRMKEETQVALLRFSDSYLYKANGLRICWFGGEPTLCLGIIDRLQTGLLELASKHNVDVWPGSIITNGYLMDGTMASHFKDIGITQAQITIDGPQPVHDARRKLMNGKGTFDRIVENLTVTSDILEINVRINIDKANVESACDVVLLLKERGILPRVRVSFAQVKSSGAACADIRERCYGDKEFSHTLAAIYGRLFEEGVYRVEYPSVFIGGAYCGALAEGYFVVAPGGELFKCWEELSLDSNRSIGNVLTSEITQRQQNHRMAYASWNPLNMSECRGCNVLPICMGGCPVAGMSKAESGRGACLPWRYNLKEMIELRYRCEVGQTNDLVQNQIGIDGKG